MATKAGPITGNAELDALIECYDQYGANADWYCDPYRRSETTGRSERRGSIPGAPSGGFIPPLVVAGSAPRSSAPGVPEVLPGPVATGGTVPTWEDTQTGEDEEESMDWGEFISGAVDLFQGQPVGGYGPSTRPSPQMGPPLAFGGSESTKVTVDTKTGKVTPCKRRRRRRLLTASDIQDLTTLAAIVGKGSDSMKVAVARAVRR